MIQDLQIETEGQFKIFIRQEPKQARMCGLKPKVNRRMIYICHLSLISTTQEHCDYFINPLGYVTSNIIGQTVTTSLPLFDPVYKQTNLFIIFHDLSVRLTGTYRLICSIVDSKRFDIIIGVNINSGIVKQVMTAPFVVYNNKNFPGNSSIYISY
ncbi:hypothetical protein BC833DRAFT_638465 [Globomyces pollinis-pini]|nr:hypothetical protein BC833DRAFT_638465 [Globomyces pollinis-pini]KAJ2999848.1 hypothetical protein HDV02_001626 [Globomyces sp. JEL0801]